MEADNEDEAGPGDSDGDDAHVDASAGWADAMAKILNKKTPASKPTILVRNRELEKAKAKEKQERLEKRRQVCAPGGSLVRPMCPIRSSALIHTQLFPAPLVQWAAHWGTSFSQGVEGQGPVQNPGGNRSVEWVHLSVRESESGLSGKARRGPKDIRTLQGLVPGSGRDCLGGREKRW